MLGQLSRRRSGGGVAAEARVCDDGGDAVARDIGRVFDPGRLQRVELEVNPAWIREVPFRDVVRTFTAAREVRVKCLICDRFEVDADVFGSRGSLKTGGGLVKAAGRGLRALEGAVVLRETVEWVEEGMSALNEEMARCCDETRVEVRMRAYTAVAGINPGSAMGSWRDLGVICVSIAAKDAVRNVWLEVDGERLPVGTEVRERP